jgi:membrane-bound ClpP family serine protease
MNKKGEISARKAWLMALVSLLDDIVVLALIILGLWAFHVEFTWWIILVLLVAMAGFIFVMHKVIIPAIRRRKLDGAEGMIGMAGKVIESLKPVGMVKIKGEYWSARSTGDDIEIDDAVEVVGINGLVLEVRKKQS